MIQDINQYIHDEFQWFHRHPELSFKEIETTKRIRQDLQKGGLHILNLPLETGVVAEVGTGKHPIVAIRCDIDALPVTEKADVPHRSEHPDCMHACGHDFHTASILGAAYLLKAWEADIQGTIRIIFQPGEEGPSGALKIIETGIIDDVDAIFGMHCTPLLDVGQMGIIDGPAMAAVDAFRITFHGKGVHAAHPDKGIDPIVTASAFVGAVQTVVSRNMDPFAATLVSVTHIEGGHNWNVIPDETFVEGTTRSMSKEGRQAIRNHIESLASSTAAAYGAKAEVHWIPGPPALINDAHWGILARKVADKQGFDKQPMAPSLGGEDFAFYYDKVPGYFVFVGTGHSYPNHNAKFKVNPAALYPASQYMAELACQAVEQIQQEGSSKG